MFIFGDEIKDNQKVDTDICVVGSGFAGIGCSQEFMDTDTDVVIVESGLLAPDKDADSLNHGVSSGINLSRGLSGSRNRQFGGTSASWSGGAGYLEPIDFRERFWINNSGWPIDESDLESHYEKAYELLELGCRSNVRKRIDKDLVKELFSADLEHVTRFISPPIHLVESQYRRYKNAQNIKVFLGSTVIDLVEHESGKSVKEVCVKTLGGKRFVVRARYVVLCCGGLENARILLGSSGLKQVNQKHRNIGKYFMQHLYFTSSQLLDSPLAKRYAINELNQPHAFMAGQLLLRLSDAVQKKYRLLNSSVHYRPYNMNSGSNGMLGLLKAIKRRELRRRTIRDFKNTLSDPLDALGLFYDLTFGFRSAKMEGYLCMEQSPNPESYVQLSDEKDRFGVPKLAVNWQCTDYDLKCYRKLAGLYGEQLIPTEKKGKLKLTPEFDELSGWSRASGSDLHDGNHHMGTTRMSDGVNSGVVDANCIVHGISNLYTLGSSVFPTGGAINPTMTILALSHRAAVHIKSRLRG